MTDDATLDIRDNEAGHRFEAWLDGEIAGYLEYEPAEGRLVLVHTEVLPAFEGRGVGSRLAASALASVRDRGLRVTPQCPFVRSWMHRHPGYEDLVVGMRGTPLRRGRGDTPLD